MPQGVGSVERRESGIAFTALFYTGLVIFAPMVTFSASKYFVFSGLLGWDNSSSTTGAAISSVVAVHVVLAMFLIAAFKEDRRPAMIKAD